MKQLSILAILTITFIISSCSSSSTVVSSWKANNINTASFDNILVIGMAGNKDREIRDNLERYMTSELATIGIQATPSMQLYGPKTFDDGDENDILHEISKDGFDAVMIISLQDKDKETTYTPGYYYTAPYPMYRTRWMYQYRYMYNQMYSPGYYSTTTNYLLEANLYGINDNQLIYSAQSRTTDPSNAGSLASEFSKSIIKDMSKQGFGNINLK